MKPETWRLLSHLHMLEFQSTLLSYGLIGIGYSGYRFTLRKSMTLGRFGNAIVEERLDKACASIEWFELLSVVKVCHVTASYSNHDPIFVDTATSTPTHRRRKKLHKFEEKWVTHLECEAKIYDSWCQAQLVGSPMHCLFEKIKRCRMDLVAWSRTNFGNTRARLNIKQ